jgi:hypothetical protein
MTWHFVYLGEYTVYTWKESTVIEYSVLYVLLVCLASLQWNTSGRLSL